jgi:Uma2 family endonuclease
MSTTTAIVTPEDVLRMGEEGKGYELVNGELKELDVSKESSHIAGEVFLQIKLFSKSSLPGWVFPEGASYRCFSADPNRVRRPDTSFIGLSRMTREEYRAGGHCEIAPDLVVEVISPNDNATEVEIKIDEWLEAGVKLVWEIYPSREIVRVHRLNQNIAVFRGTDILTAPDVLPGFSCPVADLFCEPGEPTPPA